MLTNLACKILSQNSMYFDPVTDSEEVALLGYEAMIRSEFEKTQFQYVRWSGRIRVAISWNVARVRHQNCYA